jgi:DNA modification methylase
MTISLLHGDCLQVLRSLAADSVHCCVTSPPYWGLRDYGADRQIGREETPEEYVAALVAVFREVRRVLRHDGTLWLNLGDSYAGSGKGGQSEEKRSKHWQPEYASRAVVPTGLKLKDLVGIPWRVAFALQADGWYLRSEIIWHKPNPMPESVTDRPTTAHERIFLLSKEPQYYYDYDAIREPLAESSIERLSQDIENQEGSRRANGGAKTNGAMKAVYFGGEKGRNYTPEPGDPNFRHGSEQWGREYAPKDGMRNKRTVWEVASMPFKEAHFAAYPPKLIEPCILAGCPREGMVLDPFFGAGTTGLVADRLQRHCTGIEINSEYVNIAAKRLAEEGGMFADIRYTPPQEASHAQQA